MIRAFLITCAVAFLSLVTLAGVARVKPRPVDPWERWKAERDARKAGR